MNNVFKWSSAFREICFPVRNVNTLIHTVVWWGVYFFYTPSTFNFGRYFLKHAYSPFNISQLKSSYIKLSSFLTIYLIGTMLSFCLSLWPPHMMTATMMTVFVRLFHPCFILIHNTASGILNYIHRITSKLQRNPNIPLIGRSKEYRSTAGTFEHRSGFLSVLGHTMCTQDMGHEKKGLSYIKVDHLIRIWFSIACNRNEIDSINMF